jgi:hypothetical protein
MVFPLPGPWQNTFMNFLTGGQRCCLQHITMSSMKWKRVFHRIKNYHISVKELENRVVFLRKFSRAAASTVLVFMWHVWQDARWCCQSGPIPFLRSWKNRIEANSRRSLWRFKPNTCIGLQLSFFQLDDPCIKIKSGMDKILILILSPRLRPC